METLLIQFVSLGGVAALIAALVNAIKLTGAIKDGDSQTWSAALNLLALVGLFIVNIYAPNRILEIDQSLGLLATYVLPVVGFVVMLLSSKFVHENILRGVAIIGTQFPAALVSKKK